MVKTSAIDGNYQVAENYRKISGSRAKRHWSNLRDRVDAGQAVKIVNAVLHGENEINGKKIKRNQEFLAWKVIDKMLPSLQAVSIDATVHHVQTLADIEARLMLNGIAPSEAWKLLKREPVQIEQENQHVTNDSEATPPPDLEGE